MTNKYCRWGAIFNGITSTRLSSKIMFHFLSKKEIGKMGGGREKKHVQEVMLVRCAKKNIGWIFESGGSEWYYDNLFSKSWLKFNICLTGFEITGH